MSAESLDTRRAKRLLRWYPKAWRERYGEEFADHLEQEFHDRSVDARRTFNIACKGIVTRFGDFGFSDATLSPETQTRAAVATSFALTAFIVVLVLNFWSLAMLHWSSRKYHPIPVSATTGTLTVIAFLIVLVLLAMVLTVIVSVVRQLVRGRVRPPALPAAFAALSGAFLLYAVRGRPRQFYRQMYGFPRPGIGWTHPGSVIAAMAQTLFGTTFNWISLWNQPSGDQHSVYVINGFVPIAILIFGIAIASLWRRIELPLFVERISNAVVRLLGSLIVLFFCAYVLWLAFGGSAGFSSFGDEGPRVGSVYLASLVVVAVLVGWTQWSQRKSHQSEPLL